LSHTRLFDPLPLAHGPQLKNRFMLAPLTNQQSYPDGRLSDEEFHWLTMRAKGGFGLTMTCAAHVQAVGQGFPGQLGVFSDIHLPGLERLAKAIKGYGSVASVQLHHAGNRSPAALIGQTPVCPSDDPETGARGLSTGEVEQLVEDFVAAAVRAETAGFDGVELHGAHGYILAEFLSPELNRREDRYGGSVENRARILIEIIDGVRSRTRKDFQLGRRLSPERFGLQLADILSTAQAVLSDGRLDFLDMSLWDVFKEPVEEAFKGKSLMSYFAGLDRGATKLGVAGKVTSPEIAATVLDQGADFVLIGRAAILHHDFPNLARDAAFTPVPTPVSAEHLRREGVSPSFVDYLRTTFKMVEPEPA
jgi:2,4-dienoyl-CoA reductase-like NADH-dependent reductase (Old Yellow Enzyme family)